MLTTAVLLTLVTIILVRSVLQEWHTVSAALRGLQTMELAYQAMIVAEKASLERGPMIALLGDSANAASSSSKQASSAKRARLTSARELSDAAFADALQALASSPRAEHQAAIAQITMAQNKLVLARRDVEAALIDNAATGAGATSHITRSIDKMFGVIDTALEAVTILSVDAERIYPELSQSLVSARLATELREYAARLGAQFAAPLAAQKPLGPEEKRDIPILIGRILQLLHLIELQARTDPAETRITGAIVEMKKRYFAIGLPYIDALTTAGANGPSLGNNATSNAANLVARYELEMTSIVNLRDTMFDIAREGAAAKYAEAKRNMLVNAAIGVAILIIEIGVFLLVRWRVLKPLLRHTRTMVAIADGNLDTPLTATSRKDEIGIMQNAVAKLRKTSEDKQHLQNERERMIEQLQHASSVDFLTGLLNRRAFTERANQQLAIARRQNWTVALIIFDIDHFKSVNDRFGHSTGDATLVQIANIARLEFRATDTLARYGGEEFIVLIIDSSIEAAQLLAERVRVAIARGPFRTVEGKSFSVTSSFGLAAAKAAAIENTDAFFQLADQALYKAKACGRNRVMAA